MFVRPLPNLLEEYLQRNSMIKTHRQRLVCYLLRMSLVFGKTLSTPKASSELEWVSPIHLGDFFNLLLAKTIRALELNRVGTVFLPQEQFHQLYKPFAFGSLNRGTEKRRKKRRPPLRWKDQVKSDHLLFRIGAEQRKLEMNGKER